MIQAVRHFLRREEGAVELFVALALVAILGITALVVDIGNAKQTRRNFQTAADSGSLAGAQKLLSNGTAATVGTFASDYAFDSMNQPRGSSAGCPAAPYPAAPSGATRCYQSSAGAYVFVTTPYTCPTDAATAGSGTCVTAPAAANTVNVMVCQQLATSFARILRINSTMVCNSSTSTDSGSTESRYALFAASTSCNPPGIDASSSNNDVVLGAVHSNGAITVKNNSHFGRTTYGGPSGCKLNQGNNDTYTPSASTDPTVQPWPHDYTPELPTICPTMLTKDITLNGNPGTDISVTAGDPNVGANDQAYCTTGTISVIGNSLVCANGCTMVAKNIVVTGNQDVFSPSYAPAGEPPLQMFATGANPSGGYAIDMSKNGASFTGGVFAPLGTINLTLNNNITTFLEGLNIILNQNNATITGDGPIAPGNDIGVTLVG